MTEQDWFSPHSIRYNKVQVKFLISILPLLRSGSYPPSGKETGYLEYKVLVKRGNPQAKFVRAAEIAAELDLRIQRAGLDGLLLELLYSSAPDDELFIIQHIAVALGEDIERVARRVRNALQFCSGNHRKVTSYKVWLKDRSR